MTIYAVEQGDQINKLLKILGNDSFPGLSNAVKISANKTQKEWIKTIQKSNTKNGWKKEYIRAIHINFEDDLSAEVYADENKYVNFVENGIKRFDMKPGLINGPKSRQGKKGRYNIIFFRKGVPGTQHMPAMPKVIYKKIKKAELVQKYKRGGSKYKAVLTGLRGETKKKKSGKTSIYEGLTKMGKKGHSQYGTFRVVSQTSTGWMYPGVPGVKVFSIVKNRIKPKIKKILQEGLSLDIKSGIEYLAKG